MGAGESGARILFRESVVADRLAPFEFAIREQVLKAPNLRGIGMTTETLCPFVDRAWLRAMGRSSAVILHLAHAARLAERTSRFDPGRVGLYLIGHLGPSPFTLLKEYHEGKGAHWSELLRKFWPPKGLLQTSRLMPAAHLGVFLKARGPVLAVGRCDQAVDLALTDFGAGRTDLAILVSALSLEDPLDELPLNRMDLERHECGVIVGLERDPSSRLPPVPSALPTEQRRYGIADELMRFGTEPSGEENQ